MENKEFTEEQKNQIKKLNKTFIFGSIKRLAKTTGLLLLANMAVILLDGFYVHSQVFAFVGALVSAVMVMNSNRLALEKQYDWYKEEVKKILEK